MTAYSFESPLQGAVCRGCGKHLRGKPYHMGGEAYDPDTHARARVNYYGGFVCSRPCDYRAALRLEQSMPGHGGQETLSPGSEALRRVNANWPEN